MPNFFPIQTSELKFEEPKALRIALRLAEPIRGSLSHRVLVLHGSNNWLYIGGTIAAGLVFLLGMATAHLANYPLHQYTWRRRPSHSSGPTEMGVKRAADRCRA
jgi:hypothetical protein